jgi:hypothetical protein
MWRAASAPDPAHERRGMSGCTMALVGEDPLDRVLWLQDCDYVRKNFRYPADVLRIRVGVSVSDVRFDGAPYEPGFRRLAGARVCLRDPAGRGPTGERCADLVAGSPFWALLIEPFHLCIQSQDSGVAITATDHLDVAHPERLSWQIDDPSLYERRLPVFVDPRSAEVAAAIGVFDAPTYFRDRRRWLRERIARIGARLAHEANPVEREGLAAQRQSFESRLYQLEQWDYYMAERLPYQLSWDLACNGEQDIRGDLGGTAQPGQPWLVRFWLGGWDCDLLIGYMRGSLSMPFRPGPPL